MSNSSITTTEQKDAYTQIWKYLSANGKLFIPVYDTADSSEVYTEDDVEKKTKIIRAFLDSQAIELYVMNVHSSMGQTLHGELKVGITPVKILQSKLSEVYGKESTDGITVECLLTSYDETGTMREIDTIWTQLSN